MKHIVRRFFTYVSHAGLWGPLRMEWPPGTLRGGLRGGCGVRNNPSARVTLSATDAGSLQGALLYTGDSSTVHMSGI